jgi:hypothetical protein
LWFAGLVWQTITRCLPLFLGEMANFSK